MEQIKPIKRRKELVPLSREHHDGLLLCWKITAGLNEGIPTDRIAAYVLDFFDTKLSKHFLAEERFLFTLLDEDNSYRKEAELQHFIIREMISSFRKNDSVPPLTLKYLAEFLRTHIRYEERVLFNIIEAKTDTAQLQSVANKFACDMVGNEVWTDQFWLKQNN